MQARHNQKWQALKERHESASRGDKKLKDKCLELGEWHDNKFKALIRQQETLQMTKEDVITRETRLAERKALLYAKEQSIALWEEKLEATLRAKDDELEALVCQRTKDLEDKHEVALNVVAVDSAARLKKLTDDLAAASAAKTDLDQ